MKAKLTLIIIFFSYSIMGLSQNNLNSKLDKITSDSEKIKFISENTLFITNEYICNYPTYNREFAEFINKEISAKQFVSLLKNDVFFYYTFKNERQDGENSFLHFKYESELQKKVFKGTDNYKLLYDSLSQLRENSIFAIIFDKIPDYTLTKRGYLDVSINAFNIEDFGSENKKIIEELYDNNYKFNNYFTKAYYDNDDEFDYISIPVPENTAIDIELNRENTVVLLLFDIKSTFNRVIFYNYNDKKIYYDKLITNK